MNERNGLNRDFPDQNELFHVNLHANIVCRYKRKKLKMQLHICFYFIYNYEMLKLIYDDDDETSYY
jgi:hypothetical protein